jgi:hypothetical protein
MPITPPPNWGNVCPSGSEPLKVSRTEMYSNSSALIEAELFKNEGRQGRTVGNLQLITQFFFFVLTFSFNVGSSSDSHNNNNNNNKK